MRLDHLIVRLSALLGPEWLQAYALLELEPEIDARELRFELPRRLRYHHETELYLGGVPGDLFVGFFARGQVELHEQMSAIKAMSEVRAVKDWAVAPFPVQRPELIRLDWQIMRSLRGGAEKTAAVIADELCEEAGAVEQRLAYLRELPMALSIAPPNDAAWSFTEIHVDVTRGTFKERLPELQRFGKPFGACTATNQGALMLEPASLSELQQTIAQVARIPGVRVTGFAFCEDMLWTQPWLDGFIEERLARKE
jgi:hypothetical protein